MEFVTELQTTAAAQLLTRQELLEQRILDACKDASKRGEYHATYEYVPEIPGPRTREMMPLTEEALFEVTTSLQTRFEAAGLRIRFDQEYYKVFKSRGTARWHACWLPEIAVKKLEEFCAKWAECLLKFSKAQNSDDQKIVHKYFWKPLEDLAETKFMTGLSAVASVEHMDKKRVQYLAGNLIPRMAGIRVTLGTVPDRNTCTPGVHIELSKDVFVATVKQR